MNSKELEQGVMVALEDLKAVKPVSLDVTELTSVTDYMVIASGTSGRHVRALANNVEEHVRKLGHKPLGKEGTESAEWVLIDLGDVLVHIMQEEARGFYDLEKLWSAPPVTDAHQD